jgi:hypothetical protein
MASKCDQDRLPIVSSRRFALFLTAGLSWAPATGTGTRVAASRDAGAGVGAATGAGSQSDEIVVAEGRTTIVVVEPRVGRPLERDPELVAKVPSLPRALAMDRDQRWAEAAGLYQQALIEIGAAIRFSTSAIWEQAAFKIDLERRRSRALAQVQVRAWSDERLPPGQRPGTASQATPAVERARLLRSKLMAVRSGTGSVPPGLVSATLLALDQALRQARAGDSNKSDAVRASPRAGGDPEIRLLLCATRAAAGDRMGARLELAHVAQMDRLDPARSLALGACQAALGHDDDALGSLAVAIDRLGPSQRFLPEQTRELESSNDWDPLRADPRFHRIFH